MGYVGLGASRIISNQIEKNQNCDDSGIRTYRAAFGRPQSLGSRIGGFGG